MGSLRSFMEVPHALLLIVSLFPDECLLLFASLSAH